MDFEGAPMLAKVLFATLCTGCIIGYFGPRFVTGKWGKRLTLVPLILWPIYFFYEKLIPAESGAIRMDLVFLYPLLGITTLVSIFRWVYRGQNNPVDLVDKTIPK